MNERTLQGQYAGFVSRAMALVIDFVLIGALLVVFNWSYTTALGIVNFDVQNCQPHQFLPMLSLLSCEVLRGIQLIITLLLGPLYFLFFWTLGGQTAGNAALGIRVLRLDGEPMRVFNSVRRLIGYGLCIVTFGIGFLWVIWDDRRRGWHDRIAGTCVVYSWEARQNDVNLMRVRYRLAGRQK